MREKKCIVTKLNRDGVLKEKNSYGTWLWPSITFRRASIEEEGKSLMCESV